MCPIRLFKCDVSVRFEFDRIGTHFAPRVGPGNRWWKVGRKSGRREKFNFLYLYAKINRRYRKSIPSENQLIVFETAVIFTDNPFEMYVPKTESLHYPRYGSRRTPASDFRAFPRPVEKHFRSVDLWGKKIIKKPQ